jgi:hypothetical protein
MTGKSDESADADLFGKMYSIEGRFYLKGIVYGWKRA